MDTCIGVQHYFTIFLNILRYFTISMFHYLWFLHTCVNTMMFPIYASICSHIGRATKAESPRVVHHVVPCGLVQYLLHYIYTVYIVYHSIIYIYLYLYYLYLYLYLYLYIHIIYIYYMVVDPKVLVKNHVCEDHSFDVSKPRQSFSSSSRK